MSTSVTLRMQAFVQVKPGMKVVFDCPFGGDDWESDEFFHVYRGRVATIIGFGEDYVGPLDQQGRSPGTYAKKNSINVCFLGEKKVHYNLNRGLFVLLDPTVSVELADEKSLFGRMGDLPHPILFYPGDTVCVKGDDEVRSIASIEFDEHGDISYVLTERQVDREKREAQNHAQREAHNKEAKVWLDKLLPPREIPPTKKTCTASQLSLVQKGNVRRLYSGKHDFVFSSPQEEIAFWMQKGVSETVYGGYRGMVYEWPEKEALKKFKKGECDIMELRPSSGSTVIFDPDTPSSTIPYKFVLRKLLPFFKKYRRRVRALSRSNVIIDFE